MQGIWFLFTGLLAVVSRAICGLQPYYLHFPPPFLPIPNNLESDYPPSKTIWTQWSQNVLNNSLARSRGGREFPSGPIPLVLHTWVKQGSEGTKLQNGTLIYYIGGPWGGIRSSTPSSTELPPKQLSASISNSLQSSEGGVDYPSSLPDREALLQRLPEQDGLGWGIVPAPNVDLLAPPDRQQDVQWGNEQHGFGWPSSTEKIPDISTSTTTNGTPTRSQNLETTTRATASKQVSRLPPRGESVPITGIASSTQDPVAANTDARFPVSESVRKFRRIVAQIRAITKKELGAAVARKSRKEERANS